MSGTASIYNQWNAESEKRFKAILRLLRKERMQPPLGKHARLRDGANREPFALRTEKTRVGDLRWRMWILPGLDIPLGRNPGPSRFQAFAVARCGSKEDDPVE
jgi:hypothetical protein